MISTKQVEKIVRKVGLNKGYRIIENRRILLSTKPKIFYQPDFAFLSEKGFVVIEIELTTDIRKMLVGDLIRAGLIKATHFIGIASTKSAKRAIENYGEFLTKRIKEMSYMKVFSILPKGKNHLEQELERIL